MLSCSGEGLYAGIAAILGCGGLDLSKQKSHVSRDYLRRLAVEHLQDINCSQS